MLAVNLTGAYLVSRAVLSDLKARGAGARLINIASTAGLVGYAYVAAYCAAKHGLIGLTRALALEFAKTGITVNAVCPGFTETPLVARARRNHCREDRPIGRRWPRLSSPSPIRRGAWSRPRKSPMRCFGWRRPARRR